MVDELIDKLDRNRMSIIEIVFKIAIVLAILGVVVYIIYMPSFVIGLFIEKGQPKRSQKRKWYRRKKQAQRDTADISGLKKKSPQKINSYEILGCSPHDDMGTIKKRYRGLVKKYHPDFMQAKVPDAYFVEFAKQKMQEINQAYDEIREQR